MDRFFSRKTFILFTIHRHAEDYIHLVLVEFLMKCGKEGVSMYFIWDKILYILSEKLYGKRLEKA